MWARFRIDAFNVDIDARIESLNVGTKWRIIPGIGSDDSGHLQLVSNADICLRRRTILRVSAVGGLRRFFGLVAMQPIFD